MLRTILVNPLFNILLFIYAVLPGHDFGVAIIILTILLRLALWPVVRRQLRQQKAMQELQPEIAQIKKKAGGDRQKESQMMVELFKEKEVNPFGAVGLALLQFPILIALFFVLRQVIQGGQIEHTAYGFIQNLSSVRDIIGNPGGFDPKFLGFIHMTKPNLVLALLAGLTQYVQARQLTPHNTDKSAPGAALGFNMTLMFPILTVAIAVRLPSALSLYWVASSLVAIIQQHLVLAQDVSFMRSLIPRRRNHERSQ